MNNEKLNFDNSLDFDDDNDLTPPQNGNIEYTSYTQGNIEQENVQDKDFSAVQENPTQPINNFENTQKNIEQNYNHTPNIKETCTVPKKKKSKLPVVAACVAGALMISATSSALTVTMMNSMYAKDMSNHNAIQTTTVSNQDDVNATQLNSQINQVGSEGAEVLSVPEIAEKVTPSVVGIETATAYGGIGSGTGIIMNKDGYIITNQHVIDGAQVINVVLHTGEEFTAKLIGEDAKTDLAVLKIDANIMLTPAEFGDSDELVVGDLAIAIGNPGGLELQSSLTGGYVSAINRDMVIEDRNMTLIQTDAAINPGNSGGPLINEHGQVIGINTVKISASDYEGLGFAIPINEAMIIIDELVANGHVTGRPAIGISGSEITQAASSYYNLPQGVMIATVDERADAYNKGLMYGDIIVGINGTEITTMSEINDIKENFKAGDTITLNIYRSGQNLDIDIVLMDEQALTQEEAEPQQGFESFIPGFNR